MGYMTVALLYYLLPGESAMEVIRRGKDIGTWAALESADVPAGCGVQG